MIGKHRIVASFASSGVARPIQHSKIKFDVAGVGLADDGVVGPVCTGATYFSLPPKASASGQYP